MFINVAAILVGLFNRRPRDQATLGPTMPFAKRVVVGIKEIGILRMKRLVTRKSRREQKGLPKPGYMSQVPLGGADIRHRLNDVIFGGKRLTELLSKAANLLVSLYEIAVGQVFGNHLVCLFERRQCAFSLQGTSTA